MATANHVLLRRITLSASASSVTFDSIPQTGYTDLKIVMSPRGNYSDDRIGVRMTFNGATSGYSYKRLYGYDGSNVASDSSSSASNIDFGSMPSTNATANTFGSFEVYIPNYASSNYKSVSAEQIAENNSSSRFVLGMGASLWSNSAAITSINISPSNNDFIAGSSFSLYGIANAATTPALAPKADGGDIIKTDGTYWYHIFTGTGVFKPQLNLTCDYAVVAGAGGGGVDFGGGGGAGGYRTGTSVAFSTASHTVTVGAGGIGGTRSNGFLGGNGTASSISGGTLTTVSSAGGGGGGSMNFGNPNAGGSGGGGYGGYANMSGPGAAGNTPSTSPSQGNNGGAGYAPSGYGSNRYGGGGGGATGVGGTATDSAFGQGGTGATTSISGTSTTYATGGKGCEGQSFSGAVSGAMATGNGGQGGGENYSGGSGGSGIVIIRYAV